MASASDPNKHKPLISALRVFYDTLVKLRHFPRSSVLLPRWTLGDTHPRGSINEDAARRNGFWYTAVDLAKRIPYVLDDKIKLNYDTKPLVYCRRSPDEDPPEEPWEFAKEPTFQDDYCHWKGRDVLVLTRGELYGVELIYDLEHQTITEWEHVEEPNSWRDLPAHAMTSTDNPLYQWTVSFLTLETLPFNKDIILYQAPEDLVYPGDRHDKEERRQWQERVDKYEKERELEDIYVECGWNADALDQLDEEKYEEDGIWFYLEEALARASKNFRAEEFERRRKEWKDEL